MLPSEKKNQKKNIPIVSFSWDAVKCEQVPKPAALVRYRLALFSVGTEVFMTLRLLRSKARSTGKRRLRAMKIACPSWPRATGVETELAGCAAQSHS